MKKHLQKRKHTIVEQEITFHFRHLDLPPLPKLPISIKQPQVLRLAKAVLHNNSKAVNPGSVVQPFKHRKVGRILVNHQLYTLSVIALKILIKCFAQNWIISSNMDELRFLVKCGLYTADLHCKFNQISWWLPTVPRPTMSSLVLYWAQKSGLAAVSSRRMFMLAICDNCCIYTFATVWIYRYVYYIWIRILHRIWNIHENGCIWYAQPASRLSPMTQNQLLWTAKAHDLWLLSWSLDFWRFSGYVAVWFSLEVSKNWQHLESWVWFMGGFRHMWPSGCCKKEPGHFGDAFAQSINPPENTQPNFIEGLSRSSTINHKPQLWWFIPTPHDLAERFQRRKKVPSIGNRPLHRS